MRNMMITFGLNKCNDFIVGFLSVFSVKDEIDNLLSRIKDSKTSLSSDWEAIGEDMWKAFDNYSMNCFEHGQK